MTSTKTQKQRSIFLISPYKTNYDDVYLAIKSAVEKTGKTIISAKDMDFTQGVLEQVKQGIKESDLIIADVSENDPNIMFELGIAQTENKKLIIICQKDRIEHTVFDINSSPVLFYDRKRINDTLIPLLSEYISSSNIADLIQEKQKNTVELKTIFVSYSHADSPYLERLKVHLKPFEKAGKIDLWSDTKIESGEKWEESIAAALNRAAIAILLISADFLASDFIIDNELPPLLKSAEEKGTYILPAIIKPCRFAKT